jgi:L-ascorbate metabolism protein UlaG (beta-lactamase superfamily)
MAVIQVAADELSPQQYRSYREAWRADATLADQMEREHPGLNYLSGAIGAAIKDIRATQVRKGLVVWHLYNMGYVFKTPQGCFGIDLSFRGAEQLAESLDFVLVTHEHQDHRHDALLEAMTSRGKPVVSSFYKKGRVIPIGSDAPTPVELRLGSFRVKVDKGDHHHDISPPKLNDMLMYQVDCGDCTIYHSGDGSNLKKMKPDRPVGLFIPHVSVGLPIQRAIEQLDPRMTFVSHVLELAHSPAPPHAWRWSFDYAFGTIKDVPEAKATVLTWGERWEWPGTVTDRE